jgi:hypothetical protein
MQQKYCINMFDFCKFTFNIVTMLEQFKEIDMIFFIHAYIYMFINIYI